MSETKQSKARRKLGPRIKLTAKQHARLVLAFARFNLIVSTIECRTGSLYVLVTLPEGRSCRGVKGGSGVAKIRLSGHRRGEYAGVTHIAVGDKQQCLAALAKWTEEICQEFGANIERERWGRF